MFPATYDPSQADDDTYDIVFIIGTDIKNPVTTTPKEPSPTVEVSMEDTGSSDP